MHESTGRRRDGVPPHLGLCQSVVLTRKSLSRIMSLLTISLPTVFLVSLCAVLRGVNFLRFQSKQYSVAVVVLYSVMAVGLWDASIWA